MKIFKSAVTVPLYKLNIEIHFEFSFINLVQLFSVRQLMMRCVIRIPIQITAINPLTPNWYNCTYGLFLFLRSNCCKKQELYSLERRP